MAILFIVSILAFSQAKLTVVSPDLLKDEFETRYFHGEIPHSLGNFGMPPYGSTLVGKVYYDSENKEGCTPFAEDFVIDEDFINPLIMVFRGDCLFITKVLNAQAIGAKGVIIIDNVNEPVEHVIMIDNGKAGDLVTPAILISKHNGEAIIDALIEDTVQLSITFHIRHSGAALNYTLWTTADNSRTHHFVESFQEIGRSLSKSKAKFKPHYVLLNCAICSIFDYESDEPDCVSGGRYCSPAVSDEVTGRDVILEDLLQLCIYNQTHTQDNYALWFDYVSALGTNCINNIPPGCSDEAMKTAKVDIDQAKRCVNETFSEPDLIFSDNSLLKKERQAWADNAIAFHPAIVINSELYRGELEAEPVKWALCDTYDLNQRPDFCLTDQPSTWSQMKIYLIPLIAVLVLVIIFFVYKARIRKEMREQMRQQVHATVSQYFALSDAVDLKQSDRPVVRASYY